jgi:hypothetical protein
MGSVDGRAGRGGYLSVRKSLLICALAGLAAGSAQSAEKATEKAIDADLLEFLGSLDSEETGWHDYLEQGAVKATGKKAPIKAPAKSPAPTAPADVKQVKSK